MGYNTVVVVLNDALSYIDKDPAFGSNLVGAIQRSGMHPTRDRLGASVSARHGRGVHGNAACVVSSDHADGHQIVVVHGNCGFRLGADDTPSWVEDAIVQALKWRGYRISKPKTTGEEKRSG